MCTENFIQIKKNMTSPKYPKEPAPKLMEYSDTKESPLIQENSSPFWHPVRLSNAR